jgi:hypothetical protein
MEIESRKPSKIPIPGKKNKREAPARRRRTRPGIETKKNWFGGGLLELGELKCRVGLDFYPLGAARIIAGGS